VPAPPERADRGRAIGRQEVQRQHQPEQQPQPHRHVGIAGEVEVDLQREGQARAPALGEADRAALGGGLEHWIGQPAERIGQQHLLGDAERQQHEAARQALGQARPQRLELELLDDLVMADDRSGDKVREQHHPQCIVGEAVARRRAAPEIDQIGDLLEGEEADAERQHDAERLVLEPQQRLDASHREVGVLEDAEQQQIGRHARGHHPAQGQARRQPRQQPVDGDRPDQQRHQPPVPVAVEDQRGRDHGPAPRLGVGGQDVIGGERQRQERQQEGLGMEQHANGDGWRPTLAARPRPCTGQRRAGMPAWTHCMLRGTGPCPLALSAGARPSRSPGRAAATATRGPYSRRVMAAIAARAAAATAGRRINHPGLWTTGNSTVLSEGYGAKP